MSASEDQVNQVKDKVKFSDVDSPFTRYLEVLGKVVSMSDDMLGGTLDEEKLKEVMDQGNIQKLENAAEARFMDAQTNIDVKKIGYENWQTYNEKTMNLLKDGNEIDGETLDNLQNFQANLQERIQRVSDMYDSVKKVNKELASLSEGKSSLTVPRKEWEEELGQELTQKLIDRRYLQDKHGGNERKHLKLNTNSTYEADRFNVSNSNEKGSGDSKRFYDSANGETLTAYDDFSKGPAELKHIQSMLKDDIFRLKEEVESYKQKWMTDAELFTKISSSLRVELDKRENGLTYPAQQNNNDEEEVDSEEEDEDVGRFKRKVRESEDSLVPETDSRSDVDNSLGEEEEDDDGSSGSVSSYERDIENEEEDNLIHEHNDVKEEVVVQESMDDNNAYDTKSDRKDNITAVENQQGENTEKNSPPIDGI
ncbi:THO complex subunit MFT1 [Nakaseomyces bracarensis]|uniref:THO complex subunit MFT1 n=1 Tax=Nakaseomyces bracarensis TaxID=273131 RepID=A0ABR4NXB3_9SACH